MEVGGYKLSALEIESVILQHLSVIECCVLGLLDKDYGERVCAIIVLQPNTKMMTPDESKPTMSSHEIPTWAKDKLAPYKSPTLLLSKDSPPRNAMGKVGCIFNRHCFPFFHSLELQVNKKELMKKLATEGLSYWTHWRSKVRHTHLLLVIVLVL